MMRIITGKARGTRLYTLEGDATRPTSERAKMGVFNVLQFEVEGKKVLDLFGGSGQMALEALSRGAVSAVISDLSPDACEIIRKNTEKTHFEKEVTLLCGDWRATLRDLSKKGKKFDLVFLDPPYALKLIPSVLNELIRLGLLEKDALIVCEDEGDGEFRSDTLTAEKCLRYGRICFTVLRNGGLS